MDNKKTHFSALIAGTMKWGVWGKKMSTIQMAKLLDACLDLGINSFDHADIYGHYSTEAEFGKALKESTIEREKVKLISKCGIQLISEKRSTTVKHYNYTSDYIIRSVEQSLQNLQTDYLDLLLLHRPSPLMEAEVIANAIQQLKQSGKILEFGLSNFTPSQTDLIRSALQVSYNQIEFSLTHHEAMLNGSLDHMQLTRIKPMCWVPLGSVYTQESDQSIRIKKVIATLSKKYEVAPEAVLLAWILKHPAGIIPVFGTTDVTRMRSLQESTRINLELEDWFFLWAESMGKEVP